MSFSNKKPILPTKQIFMLINDIILISTEDYLRAKSIHDAFRRESDISGWRMKVKTVCEKNDRVYEDNSWGEAVNQVNLCTSTKSVKKSID